jgi:hypothetical protein
MEMRCQNCGRRIVVDPAKTPREIECPDCGATVPHPRGATAGRRETGAEPRPTERTLRRIFEPIPRPVMYAAGLVLVLAIMAPFWLYLLHDRFQREKIFFSEDTESIELPPATQTNLPAVVLEQPGREQTPVLGQYRGIRLDSSREEQQRRFNLRLLNTRGMVPEIYEGATAGEVELVTMHFYQNQLKEFSVVVAEKRVAAEQVEKELREWFGEPQQVRDSTRAEAGGVGAVLPGAINVGRTETELERRLGSFPYRRMLTWFDETTRVEATIYFSSLDAAECVSALMVHVSAARWLETNRPRLGSMVVAPAGAAEEGGERSPAEVPKRLFP